MVRNDKSATEVMQLLTTFQTLAQHPTLHGVPGWLRVWLHTPFVDRFAYPIAVGHSGHRIADALALQSEDHERQACNAGAPRTLMISPNTVSTLLLVDRQRVR